MSRSESNLLTKLLLPSMRHVSRLPAIRRSQGDGEEGEHLVVMEYLATPSLHHLPLPPQLDTKSSPAPDPDNVSPLRHYARMAREHMSPLPSPYRWLGPEDISLASDRPIAAGGFTDIYEAMHGGRKVILKLYRCYIFFDVTQTITVCCNHSSCLWRVHR